MINSFFGFQLTPEIAKAVAAFLVIVGGFLVTGLFSKLMSKIVKKKSLSNLLIKGVKYVLIIGTIFLAVYVYEPSLQYSLMESLTIHGPVILAAVLVFVLGIALVNLFMEILELFFTGIRFRMYLRHIGFDESLLRLPFLMLKFFLYLIVLQVSLAQLNIPKSSVDTLISAISYGLAFLVIALIFFGLKDSAKNWFAGIYLNSSRFLKLGQRIFIDDADGEVIEITPLVTIVDTGKGYYVSIPNSKMLEGYLRIKKSRFDLKTLESMRRHYVAQEASYCVPAVLDIVLTLFGYPVKGGQKTIAKEAETKVPGGTEVKKAIRAVARLTKNEVKGMFVPYKDILNLRDEVKAWLSEGGLVVLNFYKAALFPGVKKDQKHAVLCMGVEGDELLIIDPNKETGGVYLVNYKDMERAMGPIEGDERGYVVYAPRGTKAYWRIKNKLLYSDPIHYEELSKGIERKLKQIFRESKLVKDVFPEYIREFLDEFKTAESEKIQRLWKP